MTISSIIGIDLAKHGFEICGIDARGKKSPKTSIAREPVAKFFANLPSTTIAVEACAGAHYWARRLRDLGHVARIIPAQFVRPFVESNKNDTDAGAIAEAARRPEIRFVPIKEQAHLDLQALHRVRDRLVGNHTDLRNQMRAILVECSVNAPKGISPLREVARTLLAQEDRLSPTCRKTITDLLAELLKTDERIDVNERRITKHAQKSDVCRRLQSVPGVGPITATAIEAAVVDPSEAAFERHSIESILDVGFQGHRAVSRLQIFEALRQARVLELLVTARRRLLRLTIRRLGARLLLGPI